MQNRGDEMPRKVMRSAKSGEFTTAAEVAAHPDTTVTETVKPSKMKPRRKTTKPRKRPKKK